MYFVLPFLREYFPLCDWYFLGKSFSKLYKERIKFCFVSLLRWHSNFHYIDKYLSCKSSKKIVLELSIQKDDGRGTVSLWGVSTGWVCPCPAPEPLLPEPGRIPRRKAVGAPPLALAAGSVQRLSWMKRCTCTLRHFLFPQVQL